MTPEPIVKTLHVGLSPEKAFALFTAKMGTWWPLDSHSVSSGQGAESKSLTLDGRVGGTLVEVDPDGTSHTWGTVQEWAPGEAFAMTWHPGKAANPSTRLRVTFTKDGDGCRVVLTHHGWEALGEDGPKMRDGYNGGWNGVLEALAKAA